MEEIKGIARVKFHPGKLEEWKRLTEQAMDIVRTQDPGTLQYEVFFNADESEAIVFERYRDADAALAHFANIGHLMEPLMATATVTGEVLGTPNDTMRAQLGDGGEPKLFTPRMAAADPRDTPRHTMHQLTVDFITSLDGCASAEGWPGWWGLEGPEYLQWLGEQPDATLLMGANTYRLMSGMATGALPDGTEVPDNEQDSVDVLTRAPKYVFSSTLDEPLSWPNSTLVRTDAVEAVRAIKRDGSGPFRTIGSLSLGRSLMTAGLVDRFRVVMFPVITGATGAERIYDGYPDVALEMTEHRTFDNSIQLLEYHPRVLDEPPLATSA